MSASKSNSRQWILGTVHWYDPKSGEGMIKSEEGVLYFVHQSAVDVVNNRRKQKALKDKQRVRFQLIDDVTFTQVSRVKGA